MAGHGWQRRRRRPRAPFFLLGGVLSGLTPSTRPPLASRVKALTSVGGGGALGVVLLLEGAAFGSCLVGVRCWGAFGDVSGVSSSSKLGAIPPLQPGHG